MEKIIIIEPGSAALHIADAVKHLGYEPIILCSLSEYSGDAKRYLQEQGHYEVDAKHVSNIIKCINDNKINDILGVISTADRFIVQACQVSTLLGCKGMDIALLKLNNKAEVTRFIPEDSPPTITFNRHEIPFDRLKKMLNHFNRLVIKPASSAGAKGLFEVSREEEIDCLLELMKKEKQVDVIDQEWLVQPVIEGILYSLEGFVLNSKPHYIGLSRRSRIKYTESQNLFPIEDEIDAATYCEFTRMVKNLINVSGYQHGYFHSEILFDGEKAYLIDANFGRVGGGSIALQIAKSTGKDIKELYAHLIETTFFPERPNLKAFYSAKKVKTLAIMYSVDKEATFMKLLLNGIVKCNHVQLAEKGKKLQPIGFNSRSWIGILFGKPEDVSQEINLINIVTEEGNLKPIF